VQPGGQTVPRYAVGLTLMTLNQSPATRAILENLGAQGLVTS
jgi:hypothetical protein